MNLERDAPVPRRVIGFLGEEHPKPLVVDGEVWPDAQTVVEPFSNEGVVRDALIERCKLYLISLHCTLWQDFLLEPDKVLDDGTIKPKGLTKAATWLADTILAVTALTSTPVVRDDAFPEPKESVT